MRSLILISGLTLSSLLAATLVVAQTPSPARVTPEDTLASKSDTAPNDLVRKVVNNEIQIGKQDHSHWMYEVTSRIPAPVKTKTLVESKDGDVSFLDEIDGRPLTPQQRTAEEKRVHKFLNDPAEQRKAARASDADDKQTTRLFAMLPNAFLFHNDGAEGENIKLGFQPNPNFTSHSSEAFVFHKMNGFVILNSKENRLVEISGRLTNRVEFMGGMLGHLDAGGTFDVCRKKIAPDHWEITKLKVNMNGKILFFKTIAVQQDEVHRNFQRIADTTTGAEAEAMAEKKSPASSTGQ